MLRETGTFEPMETRSPWRTPANGVTLLRLLLAPVLAAAIIKGASLPATVIFFVAVITDVADGYIARRFGTSSPIGGLIDHAVDAVFVTVASAALAIEQVLPALLPPLIAVAFLQYAVDSRAGVSRSLRASSLGRVNGVAYFVAVAVPIVRDALQLGWPAPGLVRAFGWLLVATTLASMIDRWLVSRRRV